MNFTNALLNFNNADSYSGLNVKVSRVIKIT